VYFSSFILSSCDHRPQVDKIKLEKHTPTQGPEDRNTTEKHTTETQKNATGLRRGANETKKIMQHGRDEGTTRNGEQEKAEDDQNPNRTTGGGQGTRPNKQSSQKKKCPGAAGGQNLSFFVAK